MEAQPPLREPFEIRLGAGPWSWSYFWTPIFEPLSCSVFDFGLFDIAKFLQSQEANYLIEQRCEASKAGSTRAALMEIQQELFALVR
jgi:hypothetical protein